MLRNALLSPLTIGLGWLSPALALGPNPAQTPLQNLLQERAPAPTMTILAQLLDPALEDRVSFPSAGVSLVRPAGFEAAELFEGFQQEEHQASLMVLSMPAPYATVMSGFDGERLASEGLTLLSQESLSISGRAGLLLGLGQRANGLEFFKWVLLLDQDGQGTVIINASFPRIVAPAVSARLKQAVLSTRLDRSLVAPPPEASVDFSLTPSPDLKLATSMAGALLYNQSGQLVTEAPGNPVFIAAASFSRVLADPADFARRRLYQTDQIAIDEITAERTVTIDGLPGYEIIAVGQDQTSATPLRIYQTMLFDDGQYIVLTGLVDEDRSDRFLAQFQRMAESFRRKP